MTKLEYEQAKMLVELKREIDKSEETIDILENKLGASLRKIQDLKDESLKSILPEAKVSLDESSIVIKSKEQSSDIVNIGFNNPQTPNNKVYLRIVEAGKTEALLTLAPEGALELAANLIKIATYKYD